MLLAKKMEKKTVHISIYNESLERMERMIEMGFTEGYNASMLNLEALLVLLKLFLIIWEIISSKIIL